MKSTENFDFNLQKARIFYSKARITREPSNLTEQLIEVSVLIRIVLDSMVSLSLDIHFLENLIQMN